MTVFSPHTLRKLLEPTVTALGYELVAVELTGGTGQHRLVIYIDQPEGESGGIGIEDCAKVSRQVSALLDVEDPISGHYTLEVSSPGLDRPLSSRTDFVRFAEHVMRVQLARPLEGLEGQRRFKGLLKGMDGEFVLLDVDGELTRLPFETIERARLVPEGLTAMAPQKRGAARTGRRK